MKAAMLAAIAAGLAAIVGGLYATGSADLRVQDRQPLAFSHAFHAGRLQVNCLYCHRHAEESRIASVPSMQVCMTCHRALARETAGTEALQAAWKRGEPVNWVRLQRLPDFVYFTHEMHLRAELRCQDCHGTVERMTHTPRAPTFEMGWCVTCHTSRGASLDCLTCHK